MTTEAACDLPHYHPSVIGPTANIRRRYFLDQIMEARRTDAILHCATTKEASAALQILDRERLVCLAVRLEMETGISVCPRAFCCLLS